MYNSLKFFIMKKFLYLFLLCLSTISCSKFDVFVDNPTINVSKTIVHNGDEITIALDSGDSNVDFDVIYYLDNKQIGSSSVPPYQIKYIVDNMPAGLYSISCKCTYSKKGVSTSSKGLFNTFIIIEVVE